MYPKSDALTDLVLVGSGGVSREPAPVHTHLSEPVCLIARICAWQHLYYHLRRPDSDRLVLLVKMFTKLILTCGSYSLQLENDWPVVFQFEE